MKRIRSTPRCPHCGRNLPTQYAVRVQDTVQRTYIVPASTAAEATSRLQEAIPPGRDWFRGLPEIKDAPFELGDEMIVRRGGYFVEGLADAVFETECSEHGQESVT